MHKILGVIKIFHLIFIDEGYKKRYQIALLQYFWEDMSMNGRKKIIAGTLLTLLLAACSQEAEKPAATVSSNDSKPTTEAPKEAPKATAEDKLDSRFVTIATGGASGPYNIIATTMGEIYSEKYKANSKTQTTGASVENINLIDQGKAEMAFVMSDALNQAINGEAPFQKKIDSVKQIAVLYPNFVQIVTSQKSGIKTIEDLKGKRVAVGDQNSGVEVNARSLLNGHGITYNDLKVDYLGYAEAADALRAGRIDAAFLTSGLPNASLMELAQGFDLQLVTVSPENIATIAQDKPYFMAMEIPANTYGNAEAIPTAVIMNALVVNSKLSDDDVYKLTKTFFENLDRLQNSHQAVKDVSFEQAQKGMVAPIHPGAQKYYDEQNKQ